jgi:hypothetical protein
MYLLVKTVPLYVFCSDLGILWILNAKTQDLKGKSDWPHWLVPVILATWEVKIGRSWFKANPGKNVSKTLYQRIRWVRCFTPIIPAM